MKPSLWMSLALAAPVLLLPACDDSDDATWGKQDEATISELRREREPQGDVNAYDEDGMTRLAELSRDLRWAQGHLRDAMNDEDDDMAAMYREEVDELKTHIREQLRAGADPCARSLDAKGKLGDCALQYWSPEFIHELRQEGFNIPESPENPPAPAP